MWGTPGLLFLIRGFDVPKGEVPEFMSDKVCLEPRLSAGRSTSAFNGDIGVALLKDFNPKVTVDLVQFVRNGVWRGS